MSGIDPNHDPVAYEAKVIQGFEQMHEKTIKNAAAIVVQYKGENPSCIPLGLNKLDELALKIVPYIEEASSGQWPKQVLTILGKTMACLTSSAAEIRDSARKFDVLDMSFAPSMNKTPGILH